MSSSWTLKCGKSGSRRSTLAEGDFVQVVGVSGIFGEFDRRLGLSVGQ